jgi:hypothetical protein
MKKMKEAAKAVEQAGIPDDLRVAAFEKGFEALIGHDVSSGSVQTEESVGRPPVSPVPTNAASVAAIADRLGIEQWLAEEIYEVEDNGPGLIIAPSKFNPKKAAATQEIALLLAAGRQASGWEEWTSVAPIRNAARDYAKFDPANFATTIRRMGDVFSFRGKARQLEVRVTRPGYEQASRLARELTGAGV